MNPQSRQEFIKAAVSFLQNPKLVDSSLKDKLKFLKDKGLNECEVDEALNLALINRSQPQSSRWNFLIVLGLCVGGYKLYKTYVETNQINMTQQSSNERQIRENQKIQDDKREKDEEMPTLQEILQRMADLKRLIELQRTNFSTEIQSIKTLLLGHEKFAAPPVIPVWQLKDSDEKTDTPNDQKDVRKTERKKHDKISKRSSHEHSTNGFIDTKPIGPNLE